MDGKKGDRGTKGDQGPMGLPGPMGFRGDSGNTGAVGKPGYPVSHHSNFYQGWIIRSSVMQVKSVTGSNLAER